MLAPLVMLWKSSPTPAPAFVYTQSGEPHAKRRIKILKKHPEIRDLFGYDIKTTYITLFLVPLQLSIAYLLDRQASLGVVLFLSYFVGAIISHWLTMTIHETSHNLACKTQFQNKLLALFANLPCILPMSMTFHRYHIAHHVYLGVDQKDTDLPFSLEVRVISNSAVRKFLWLLFYMLVYTVRGLFFIHKPNRLELLNLFIQILFVGVLWQLIGVFGFLYLILSIFFAMSLHPVAAHFIHEHYTFSPGQETYSYYGPLNWVTFNVGYHNEHHDFMSIPGSRLPKLKKIAQEFYDPLVSHRSWTKVLFMFITRPKMGVGSRIVRTKEDFIKGKVGKSH